MRQDKLRTVKDPRVGRAHKVDVYVGTRVRNRRKALKISQQELAAHLDLTFQQVQKYERGSNRISASKLFETAAKLGVPISYFFEGCPPIEGQPAPELDQSALVQEFWSTPEGEEMAKAYITLPTKTQKILLDLIKAMLL